MYSRIQWELLCVVVAASCATRSLGRSIVRLVLRGRISGSGGVVAATSRVVVTAFHYDCIHAARRTTTTTMKPMCVHICRFDPLAPDASARKRTARRQAKAIFHALCTPIYSSSTRP